jgi:hypothetical protein
LLLDELKTCSNPSCYWPIMILRLVVATLPTVSFVWAIVAIQPIVGLAQVVVTLWTIVGHVQVCVAFNLLPLKLF